MRFADIIGQSELKRHLAQSVDSGRISHAQLFIGAAGTGALPLALAYAQYIHCTDRHGGDSCGVCPSCRQVAALAHPDLHFVFPVNKQGKKSGEVMLSSEFMPLWRDLFARTGGYFHPQQWFDALNLGKTLKGTISTKESEEIIRKLSFKSFESEYKTMIVWLPETMNDEAANRILKILEEPWERTVFLLVSERPDLLLKTIISRTQEVVVPRLTTEDLESELRLTCAETDPVQLRNMARLACGDVLELRRIAGGETDEARKENFDAFCAVMRLSYNDRHLELMNWAEDVAQLSRERQRAMLTDFSRLLREAYMLHAGAAEASYLWGEEADFCRKFSPFINSGNVEGIVAQIESALRQIGQNGNPRIVFTHFALAVSKFIRPLKR